MAKEPRFIGMAIPKGSKALSAMRPRGSLFPMAEPDGRVDPHEMTVLPMPNAAGNILRHGLRCFPSASPAAARGPGKQKAAPKDSSDSLIFLRKSGAGDGIRTHDPNLGKVVFSAAEANRDEV